MSALPVSILGPTASGKSSVAMAVAERIDRVEIVSVDSMQVYREMDIGTAKPTPAEQARIRHHLIDVADPADEFTVSMFQESWRDARADIEARGKIPLLVGGTGLYLRSIIDELEIPGRFPDVRRALESRLSDLESLYAELDRLDPEAASRIDPRNERRIVRALEVTLGSGRPFSSYGPGLEEYPSIPFRLLGLRMNRELLDERIDRRYDAQMADGFLDEVRALSSRPAGIGRTARQALGYRELLQHVEARMPLDVQLDEAKVRTRRFARRQLKWFGRDPRIEWVEVDERGVIGLESAIARAVELVHAGAG